MSNNTVGTPKKVTIDGTTFDVMADANFSQIKGRFANENVPTSGKNLTKKTVRPQNVESVNVAANSEEAELLKQFSERTFNYPISYEIASGDVFRAVGGINFESHDTETGVAAIQLLPEDKTGFTLFGA